MLGYLDDPDATAAAIDADGWLHTGDIGTVDAAGNLRITDRLKDTYICGGFNVLPRRGRTGAGPVGGVADAAVIGVPTSDSVRSAGRSSFAGRQRPRRAGRDRVHPESTGELQDTTIGGLFGRVAAKPRRQSGQTHTGRWFDGSHLRRQHVPSATRCAPSSPPTRRRFPPSPTTPPRASNSTGAGTACCSTPACR